MFGNDQIATQSRSSTMLAIMLMKVMCRQKLHQNMQESCPETGTWLPKINV